jgi:hypothetical protein
MNYELFTWVVCIWFAINVVAGIALIGQERKPIRPLEILVTIACYAVVISSLWW